MLIDMKVSSLTVDPFTNMPIVILKDHDGGQTVPIWIGLVEASAIATELEKIHLDRPMTHDLMKTILGRCEVRVDRVEVHDLRDNTFYATIFLEQPDPGAGEGATRLIAVDARPSDAIALALRTGAGIRVAKKVIDKAQRMDLRLEGGENPPSMNDLRAPSDFLATPHAKGLREDPEHGGPGGLGGMGGQDGELLEELHDSAFGKWKM